MKVIPGDVLPALQCVRRGQVSLLGAELMGSERWQFLLGNGPWSEPRLRPCLNFVLEIPSWNNLKQSEGMN